MRSTLKGVRLHVLGGGCEVGRVSLLLRPADRREGLLLDAGVSFDEEDRPVFAGTYPPKYVKAIVLSHAHLDHIGTAPMYYISCEPPLYATRPTLQMAKLMIDDFLKLNGYYSPYEASEAARMLENSRTLSYGQSVYLDDLDMCIKLFSAGHIPGSAMVLVEYEDLRVLFTGDVNTVETKLMKPADASSIGRVDVLITEATYGDTTHPPRRVSEERLISVVEEVVDAGGTVLVPAFSVARGQEIMMVLAERDLGVPVAVDGLIRQVTEIFLENHEYIRCPKLLEKAYREFRIVRGWQDRNKVWREPGVIIASAGMLKGGPSLYYLKKLGRDPKNAVVMVSYQAKGSPGRRILEEGLMPESEEPVKARVEWIDFSSHADRLGLQSLARSLSPSKIVVVHSNPDTARAYADYLLGDGLSAEIVIAENGREYDLTA